MPKAQKLPGLLLLGTLLLFSACRSREEARPEYYLISVNIRVPYWQTAGAGFTEAASQLHVKPNFVGPDTYDPKAEQEEFRRVVQRKPAGILVSAADPELLKAEIDAAIAAGIPVITMDSDSPTSKRLLFIGTNNYQAGRLGGQITAQMLHGKGSVVFLTMPGQANLDERFRGYSEVLVAYPDITVARVIDIKGDPRIAFEKTTELMRNAKDKVDAFVCLEALACKEVAKVLSTNHITGKIVAAMDTDPETLDWIRKGVIAITIAQKPFTMGFVGLKMLDDLNRYKLHSLDADWAKDPFTPIPSFVDTGVTLIEKQTVDAFIRAESSRINTRR